MTTQSKQSLPGTGSFGTNHILQLVAAIGGNVILAGMFIKALLNPGDNAEFIVKTSALIFVIEFLAIHSSVFLLLFKGISMAFEKVFTGFIFILFNWRKLRRANDIVHGISHYEKKLKPLTVIIRVIVLGIPVAFYAFFALAWGQSLNNLELPIYFGISLAAKHFSKKAFSNDINDFPKNRGEIIGPARWTPWLLISFFIPAIFACQLERWFPFPEEVYFLDKSTWIVSGSGPCLGMPHHWVVWGALYYGVIAVLEIIWGIRRFKKTINAEARF